MNFQTNDFLAALSDSKNVTGGGSAAALNGAVSASLVIKVFDNEYRKDRHPDKVEEIESRVSSLHQIKNRFQEIINEDPEALHPLISAYKLPKESDEEQEKRQSAIQDGIEAAARPQVEIMELLNDTIEHQRYLIDIRPSGEIVTNLAESILFAQSALNVAYIGSRTNFEALSVADKRKERLDYVNQLLTVGEDRLSASYDAVRAYIEETSWAK